MTNNLRFKSTFLREELDNFGYTKADIIRTDFVLENVFSYLVRDHYDFNAISGMNEKENHLIEKTKEILNAFTETYTDSVKQMCAEIININEDDVGSILLGVGNELFAEGIT